LNSGIVNIGTSDVENVGVFDVVKVVTFDVVKVGTFDVVKFVTFDVDSKSISPSKIQDSCSSPIDKHYYNMSEKKANGLFFHNTFNS
jgi:hypothetical protein